MKRSLRLIFLLLVVALAATACHRLSSEAKKITGNYFIPEISEDEPLLELRKDATCTLRAIKPGVLTYSVDGYWNVLNDSLVADVDPSTIVWEGDSSLIGEIAPRFTRHVVSFNDVTLTVEKDGVQYVYHRRQL